MASLSPIPFLQDLKLTVHESTLVYPSQETLKKSTFLSNSDLFLNDLVRTAHFFKANPDFTFEDVAHRLKVALEKILVPYHFMAGRLKQSSKSGRLELDCNEAGASFVVASSQLSLDDIVDYMAYPNLGFRQLVVRSLDTFTNQSDKPVLFLQVTSFIGGGFALGLATNHIVLDGMGVKVFVNNLASQAFDGNRPLDVVPLHNRQLLAARCPPVVAFPHPEFCQPIIPINQGSADKIDVRIFKLSPSQMDQLKEQARNSGKATTRISSFAVVAALIWQCKTFSEGQMSEKDKISMLINIMDIRGRMNPPLPLSYSANAILPIGVSATHEELENRPLGELAEMIVEGAKVMTGEYAKSALDWLEVYKGIPGGNYKTTSWLRLGFDQVGYPWGKPMYSCPVAYDWTELCVIFPDAMDGGISAMVALPANEMEIFEARFRKFFA